MSSQYKKISKYFTQAALILLLFCNNIFADNPKVKISIIDNPKNMDFWWIKNNNFGIDPSSTNNGFLWYKKNSTITYQLKTLVVDSSFNFNESFIKYNFSKETYLRFGKYYRDYSTYFNDSISSGRILISNNAEAIPKVGFVSAYKINKANIIDFNFGISHGILDKNTSYTKPPMLHEKFIYMTIRSGSNSIFEIGFVHEAIWGGKTLDDGEYTGSSLKDFLKVFISADGPLIENTLHANALGNHLGIWDFSYQKRKNDKLLKIYYQHFFEDTSGLRFANKTDGLWGLELENYLINTNILIEYLSTMNQDLNNDYLRDGYYNHSTYNLGWSYKDYIIGNPFINNLAIVPTEVMHLGIEGKISNSTNSYKILSSRRINISDDIKLKIVLKRQLFDTVDYGIFLVSDGREKGLGFSLDWIINN